MTTARRARARLATSSTAAYIVAFSLFIVGIRQGTHPTTAKRGNLIAAVGMAVAVATTLLLDGIGNWGLIIGGILIGHRASARSPRSACR